MSKKNLLTEAEARNWMKLSGLQERTDDFLRENFEKVEEGDELEEEDKLEEETVEEGEETLDEDNFDKTGPGPERGGTKKNNHDGEKGKAQNQGKEPKDTPDGKLEIPGTSYAGDHKNKSKSPEKGSTDGGTQLQGKGNVTESKFVVQEMPDDELEGDDMGDDMGGDLPPAPDAGLEEPPHAEPDGDEGMGAGGLDVGGLVRAIVDAISAQTGVDISVDGGGDEMGAPEMGEPALDEPAPDMGAPEMDGPGPDVEEPDLDDEETMQEMVNEISKRVARRLLQKENKRPQRKRVRRRVRR